jgi:genome maintenance exonuclease 1|tara:strand:- start:1851 stop:2624 length:774 start_codon:yes stop_codon:yes gene_type:complete
MEETIERVEIGGKRHYQVSRDNVIVGTYPSMTTILGGSKDERDMDGLQKWRDRVGHVEADRISYLSMNRGTIMHRLIELYKATKGTPEERLQELHNIAEQDEECTQFNEDVNGTIWWDSAWEMFMKFWNNHDKFFDRVEEVLMAEGFIWSERGFAGTLDNASKMVDGGVLIIDYKNSRKPKRDMWIEDYFCQVAGYSVAFFERTGTAPTGCEIWIANEIDDEPQNFKMTYEDIKYYFKKFMKRLRIYEERNPISNEG